MLQNRSIPRCTVIPQLAYPDVIQAVTWLCSAFGFTVRISMGSHRAQLNVGDGAVVIMESPTGDAGLAPADSPCRDLFCSVMVRVADVDRHCAHARQAGAKILREPATHPYGERQYSAEDFAGRIWAFSQSVADMLPEDWGGESVELK